VFPFAPRLPLTTTLPSSARGCGDDPCGRKAGPKREQTRREHKSTKSRAGRRTIGLPDPLIKILRQHGEVQERERSTAGADWEGKGYVFASPVGGPLSPNTDFHVWTGSGFFGTRAFGTGGFMTRAKRRRTS